MHKLNPFDILLLLLLLPKHPFKYWFHFFFRVVGGGGGGKGGAKLVDGFLDSLDSAKSLGCHKKQSSNPIQIRSTEISLDRSAEQSEEKKWSELISLTPKRKKKEKKTTTEIIRIISIYISCIILKYLCIYLFSFY